MSVNQRLVNPLTDTLFDAILSLKTRDECYEFLKISVPSMSLGICPSGWRWPVCWKTGRSMTRSRKNRRQHGYHFQSEAVPEVRRRWLSYRFEPAEGERRRIKGMEPLQMSREGFKAYDIRGIVPGEVNEELAYRVGRAYGALYHPKAMCIGFDVRPSSRKSARPQQRVLWMRAPMYMTSVSAARK